MKKLLVVILVLIPSPALALSGYLFAQNDFFKQTWERTIQGRWHYDEGPSIGLRLQEEAPAWTVFAELAAVPISTDPEDKGNTLGVGIVGQRSKIGARVGYDSLSFEAAYEFRSWFISGRGYGPNWSVEPNDTVQDFTVRVTARVF